MADYDYIKVAYCGGKMKCDGYQEPNKTNIVINSSNSGDTNNIINDTDADAFVYTYKSGNTNSYLHVIKSCCKPYMVCGYADGETANSNTYIYDSSNVWSKEFDVKYIVNYNAGTFEPSEADVAKYWGVSGTAISYANQNDINEYRSGHTNPFTERYNTLLSYLRNVDAEKITSSISTSNGSTEITYYPLGSSSSATVFVVFDDYTSELKEASKQSLNNINFANSAVTITFKLNSSESEPSTFAAKRASAFSSICKSNISFTSSNSGSSSTIQIRTKKAVFGYPLEKTAVEADSVLNATLHFKNVDGTNDMPIATTPSMFAGLENLTSCSIPCQMRYISNNTFANCTRLSECTYQPNFVDTIGVNAFNGTNIQTAKIGNFTIVKNDAFANCHNLTTIEWNNDETNNGKRCRLNGWTGSTGYNAIPERCFMNCYRLRYTKLESTGYTRDVIIIPSGFTEIGVSAFENCSGITAVNLNGVKILNNRAFCNCTSINSISGMNNVTFVGEEVFYPSGTSQTNIIFYGDNPFGSVEIIKRDAFKGKTLNSSENPSKIVTLSAITSIGENAFSGATINGFLSITKNSTIGSNAFNRAIITGSVNLNASITVNEDSFNNAQIGGELFISGAILNKNSFRYLTVLGNATIKNCTFNYASEFSNSSFYNGLTITNNGNNISASAFTSSKITGDCYVNANNINNYAFEYVSANTFYLTANTINSYAFRYSSGNTLNVYGGNILANAFLSSRIIEANLSGITSLGNSSFSDSSTLKNVGITGASNINIGNSAFTNCSELSGVTISSGVTSIGAYAFYNCRKLYSIFVPNNVTSIGENAFRNCSGLTGITIQNGAIGNSAFTTCSSATSLTLENGVTTIGNYSFASCIKLTSLDIPASVTSIGSYAFSTCSGLQSITVRAATPPTLGNSAFANTNNCTIYVPSGSEEAYKTASGWSTYESRISSMP